MNPPLRAVRPVIVDDKFLADDTGSATVEYAVLTLGTAAIALLVVSIAKSHAVLDALTSLITRALSVKF